MSTARAELSEGERAQVVEKKATCPFIATGVKTGALPVRNSADKPLANIADVVKLGNTGKGSNLGDLLEVFAQGNHGFMPRMSGKLDLPVPKGTLSLDFPAYSVDELRVMFKDKQFPPGWESWKNTSADWAVNATALVFSAEKELIAHKLRE